MYLVEYLTLRVWFFSVLPQLIFKCLRTGRISSIYFIDASMPGFLASRITAWAGGVAVTKLAFRLIDVRDEAGLLIRLRITYRDLAEVLSDAAEEPLFRAFASRGDSKGRLPAYLMRSLGMSSLSDRGTLWHALFLVQVCAWKIRSEGVQYPGAVLFLERRPWLRAISRYASRYGVEIVPVRPPLSLRRLSKWVLGARGIAMMRSLRNYLYLLWSAARERAKNSHVPGSSTSGERIMKFEQQVRETMANEPQVAVEYHGQFNLDKPGLHSDFFFWQQSALPGKNIVALFGLRQDPLDERKWAALTQNGMSAVCLHPQASKIASVPLFTTWPQMLRGDGGQTHRRLRHRYSIEGRWLEQQVQEYDLLRRYWTELFSVQNVKIYVTWFRYDARHCAIADALEDLDGVTAIYQRACEPKPSPEIAIDSDIMFGYAPGDADVERQSLSRISYHVAVGYFGDYRFPLLRETAQQVRNNLQKNGAEYILAFFDENSADDSRWHTGHEFMRENYAFLLEKMLAKPWLGLVFKPKYPPTLRKRLGPVAELLKRAEATGRCYVYEEGLLHGSYPPAVAALSVDVAIHGHLCAGTAGLEAALAGVPTLLLDREGWHVSPLYRLGVGTVVFRSWEELWDALMEHRKSAVGIPKFGDWSHLLDELDPFRDGRAAERMGTYIKWLIDGFKAGLDRDTVMADAAERYCAAWGRDKITEVNYPGKIERLVPKQTVPLQGGLGRADRGALAAGDS